MRNKKLAVLFAVLAVVTTLVVLSSVVFSVQSVYAHCYNADDELLDDSVASKEVNEIRRGSSMFMLDEDKVIRHVEDRCSNVMVVNVERKFPNRVYINYVKVFPTLVLETEDRALKMSATCKILDVSEKSDKYEALTKVLINGEAASTTVGEKALSPGSVEYDVSYGISDIMIKMDLYNETVQMLELIDVTKTASTGVTFVKTRTGVFFELQGGADKIAEKMRLAVSVYLSDETTYMRSGTIIVNASGSSAAYSPYDRYSQS